MDESSVGEVGNGGVVGPSGSLDSITNTPHQIRHFGETNGTPKHSFAIPNEAKIKHDDESLASQNEHRPHHRGSTLGTLTNIINDTGKNIKRAQLKMKRDLKVGMEKMSGKDNANRERMGHIHAHEPQHPVLAHHPTMINPRNKYRLW
jgi:hypothetical protein